MSHANAIAQVEARIDSRFPASAVPAITSVRLSPGDAVELVNISKSGVLVEGRTRFVPGTRVTVIFDGGFTPANVKGKVVRCQVSSISGGALRYQSGIQFDTKLDHLDPQLPAGVPEVAAAPRVVTPPPAAAPAAAAPRRVVNRW
jgi:PilZ domain